MISELKAKQLTEILEVTTDAIISINNNHDIVYFNHSAELLFGYKSNEILGKPLGILLPADLRSSHNIFVDEFALGDYQHRLMNARGDFQGLRKDGTTFPAKASISKVELDDGIVLTAFVRDITDIQKYEMQISADRDELSHLNRASMLGAVSASLVHELNQPLSAILANSQVLKRQLRRGAVCTGEMQEIIADVIDDSLRMSGVINNIKMMLKSRKLSVELIDINETVESIRKILRSELIMNQTLLSIDAGHDLPKILGDYVSVQQVLVNLVLNAIDAMDMNGPGDRKLEISTQQTGLTELKITVRDNGKGIPIASSEKILEPFFTSKEKGMGMGLSISRSIVEDLGGCLWFENNEHRGVAFHFTLPIDSTVSNDEIEQEEDSRYPARQEGDEAATVFIVDDDPAILKALGRVVSSWGYKVQAFSTAAAYLEWGAPETIGCLLLDLHMPGISGLQLQAALNEQAYTLPVIFLTGAEDTSSSVAAMKYGAVDYLSKPVDADLLLTVIEQAIERDRIAREDYALKCAAREKLAKLTPRELEVMALVVEGMPNKIVAYQLGITEKTVKAHRGNVMHKIGIRSLPELVRISELVADKI
jgi:two-component system sensor kinase FixL